MKTSLYQGRLVFSCLLLILLSASLISCARTKPVVKKKKVTNAERLDRLASLCLQGKPVFPIPGTTVRLICKYEQGVFFSRRQLASPTYAKATEIKKGNVPRFILAAREFASVYEPSFLSRNLKAIYATNTLHFHGKEYGGTYKKSSIYIASDRTGMFHLVSTMHSELSSILIHRFGLSKNKWIAVNVRGWRYFGSGFGMLGQKKLLVGTAFLWQRGFLVKYSQASLEDDFNQFASWLFASREDLERLAKKYPRIRGKYELTKAFYRRIKALR